MWDIRRRIDVSEFPQRRIVISFMFRDMPSNKRAYWLIVEHGVADLCMKYPGFEPDLAFVTTSKAMADIWMNYSTMQKEIRNKTLKITGAAGLKSNIDDWFSYSFFSSPDTLREELSTS